MIEILKSGQRKAAKTHTCDFCYGIIEKDEIYEYQNNKYDGDLYTWKSHIKCSDLASCFNLYDDCENGLTGEYFQESISEIFDDNFKLAIKFKMNQKINLLYNKYKESELE